MASTLSGAVIVITPAGKQEFPWARSVKVEKSGTLHIYGERRRHFVFEPEEWTAYMSAQRAKAVVERKAITAGEL